MMIFRADPNWGVEVGDGRDSLSPEAPIGKIARRLDTHVTDAV